MFSSKRQIIGIDLGASCAKAVVLKYGAGDAPTVIREYAMLPSEDRELPLDELLRALLRKLRTRCRDCAISAWPAGARLRFFDGKAEPELVRALRHGTPDAQALFHEKLDDYVAQCGRVTSLRGDDNDSMFVASGIPRGELTVMENTLRKLGYTLRLLQLTPVAILNAFTASQSEIVRKQPFLVVDFGRARMTILGGSRGSVRVMRRVDFPWGEIPLPLISAEESETPAEGSSSADEDALSAIFGDVTELLVSELQPVLESFRMQDEFFNFDRIYVSGGLSNHRAVIKRLAEGLHIERIQWNSLRHISAHHRALENFTLLSELAHLPAAAGAAFQCAA